MCKHIEIVIASRNAVVALRASLGVGVHSEKEFARREVGYDVLLNSLKKECVSCKEDNLNPKRKSNFLRFVDEFVNHFDGASCEFC